MKTFLLLLAASVFCWAADDVPQWAREAAVRPAPVYPAKAEAVVLFEEESLTVEADGKRVMQERGVIRKLTEGRMAIGAYRYFNSRSGRIRDIRGWVFQPDGKVVRLGKEQVVERSYVSATEYDEYKVKAIEPGQMLKAGSVFAYEIVEEEKTVFTQYLYRFQGALPVLQSRFVLTLPAGWESSGTVFNRPGTVPAITGNTSVWELKDLPWIEDEEHRPRSHSLLPRLVVSYFPGSQSGALRPLKDWAAVSAWLSGFSDQQAEVTPAIQSKTDQLLAGATGEWNKIQRIAAFVQATNYISIQMNLTRGGGYTPHKAEQVLNKSYGDCKDKATLMKAMLKAAGIPSHLVVIYSGDRDYVRSDWASPMQFNHMVIAVRLSDPAGSPAVLKHETLGNLLIFDPTDPYTPPGGLPEDEQGSHALVLAGDKGKLIRVPLLPPSANRIESDTTGAINSNGGIDVKVTRTYHGQTASQMRGLVSQIDAAALQKVFESVLTRQLGGLALKPVKPAPTDADKYQLNIEFAALQFGRLMQNRLLIVTPGALLSGSAYAFPATARKLPVRLEAKTYVDRVRIDVPEGFVADEMPGPMKLREAFGSYEGDWNISSGTIEFRQSLEVKHATVPVENYAQLRSFFEKVNGAANGAVVLVKK